MTNYDAIRVPLSRGLFALIDAADEHLLEGKKWTAGGEALRLYAYRNEWIDGKLVRVYLHRRIMDAPPGMYVDHVDGVTLDCRRANMRIVTPQQNSLNRRSVRGVSGYRGVGWVSARGMWRAQFCLAGSFQSIGFFDDPRTAAVAFDAYIRARPQLSFMSTNADLGLL